MISNWSSGYEKYTASGLTWPEEMPAHWKRTRFKYLAKIRNGQDYKHVEAESGYPVYGSGGQFTFANSALYEGESLLLGRKGTIDVCRSSAELNVLFCGIQEVREAT